MEDLRYEHVHTRVECQVQGDIYTCARSWHVLAILLQILILTCTYTANLASIITTASTAVSLSNVTSFDSLRGTTVLAYPIYVNVLEAAQGITASPFRLGQNGFFNVSDMLTSGSILAYIHDAPVLQYLTNRFAESCHLKLIPGLINPFSYGYAFSANFNYSLLSDFNAGLLLAQVGVLGGNDMLKLEAMTSGDITKFIYCQRRALHVSQISHIHS